MKRLITLFAVTFSLLICKAADLNFRFRHLTVDDGLPANTIQHLLQDRKGFIWINTSNGLCRYDGISFRYFAIDRNQSENSAVSDMFEDADGRIWLGTRAGLYRYNPTDFSISPLMSADSILSLGRINKITGDKKYLWFAAESGMVYRYSFETERIDTCRFYESKQEITDLFIDSYGTVWLIAGSSDDLLRWDEENASFMPYQIYVKGEGRGRRVQYLLQMFEDSNHALWITSWNAGLFKLNRSSHELIRALPPSPEAGLTHIHSIEEWQPGTLLIGSDNGLTLYNYVTGQTKLYLSEQDGTTSLSDEFVYPILRDREGGLWVGTYYGGINYSPAGEKPFKGFVHSRHKNSVSGNIIGRFCEDRLGNIWIASDDGGLNCYSPEKEQFSHYMPAGKSSFNVHALCMDDDNLWIGTYDGGIYSMNIVTKMLSPVNLQRFETRSLYEIHKGRNGWLWLGSMMNIMAYDKEKKRFPVIKQTGSTTVCIKEDLSGNIWFATLGKGLFKYTVSEENWKNYLHSTDKNSLPNDVVNCIYQDEGGELWIGTDDGLCRYLPEQDAFERYYLNLPGKSVYSIIEDNHQLWLTTSMGLVCHTPSGGSTCYTKEDGLQSNVFVSNAGLKASDGTIYVGTVNGFNSFAALQIHRNEYIPPVVLTQLELNNVKVEVGPQSLLKNALSETGTIELSYRNNMVGISYAALSYSTPARNQYAYMMEGFDTDWNYVGNQTKAIYSHLPAGKYRFRVKACNNDQVWNEKGVSLQIVVHPPFYLSTFCIILYLIAVIGLIAVIVFYLQKRSVRKHRNELLKVELDKESELNSARVDFFTTIAHEIRTPVSLITAPLEKIMKSVETFPIALREDLKVVERNSARLLFLVNQFLDFRKIEQSEMKLKFTTTNIYPLLQTAIERFTLFFEQKGIHTTVECNNKNAVASVDGEALNIIIGNLLSNAYKYTRSTIVIRCDFYPPRNRFELSVTDNGNGIAEEQRSKIFKPFYQIVSNKQSTGIGLSIVKRYVEAHNGSIEVDSVLGKGTTFTVKLPITQSPLASPNGEKPAEAKLVEPPIVNESIIRNETEEPVHGEKKFLLIVEDNDEMLSFLTGSFSDEYIVSIAKDGKEALSVLNENGDINLIISDLMMPRMDGIELCKAIRENMFICHIPFILLTAKTDMVSKVESMNIGVDVFVEKPFSIEYLKACAHNLIELRKMLWLKFMKMPLAPLNSVSVNHYDEDFLNKLNAIIAENFSNAEMSVEFLADKLCISRSKLFVKIKSLTNCTPNELIQVVRLKKAAELLLENRYRINEICYMVGFNNHSYFSKCFQKQFGMKPQDFVRSKKEDTANNESEEDN